MPVEEFPILRTKLHRPRPAPDAIARPRLIELLNRGLEVPVTLVCAPAGFGKSTLVSQSVGELDANWKCGWYSIDESDNELKTFLLYLVSAVRGVAPSSCDDTLHLVQADALLSGLDAARILVNELLDLEHDLIMVLDDFQHIQDPAINEFLAEMLLHPPPCLRLVIVARRDPALSLNQLRGRGYLIELRLDDLRFSREEAAGFLGLGTNESITPALMDLACEQIEGWPMALRLLALSQRGRSSPTEASLSVVPARVGSYLIEEILDQLPTERVEALLQTSRLDRFCASLCEAVVPGLDGASFLAWLQHDNLFVTPLDAGGHWFRYHHYFRDCLQRILRDRSNQEEWRGLHRRSGQWFAAQNLSNEALSDLLEAGDLTGVGQILAREIREKERGETGFALQKWLERVPEDLIRAHPVLGIERSSTLLGMSRIDECARAAKEAESSLVQGFVLTEEESRYVRGMLLWFQAWTASFKREFGEVVRLAEAALELLPPGFGVSRSSIYVSLSANLWYTGERERARAVIEVGLREFHDVPLPRAHVCSGECLLDLCQGDMNRLLLSATHLARLGEKHRIYDYGIIGRYYASWACYQLDDLDAAWEWCAEGKFDKLMENRQFFFFSRQLEVLIQLAERHADEAELLLDPLHELTRRDEIPRHTFHYGAAHALMALARGRPSEAMGWAEEFRTENIRVGHFDERASVPVQILLARGTSSSRIRAGEILREAWKIAESCAATPTRTELLILRALWHHAGDRETNAKQDLAIAVELAQSGGMIRLLADIAMVLPDLIGLLQKLVLDEEAIEFVGRVVQAAVATSSPAANSQESSTKIPRPPASPLIESLSKREHEILLLISNRLSNNEIAEKLFISVGTVKRHLSNIYEKLGVHSRKEAVAKAVGLGLLER